MNEQIKKYGELILKYTKENYKKVFREPMADHALITWLSCTAHVAGHTLITCLVMHRSRDKS